MVRFWIIAGLCVGLGLGCSTPSGSPAGRSSGSAPAGSRSRPALVVVRAARRRRGPRASPARGRRRAAAAGRRRGRRRRAPTSDARARAVQVLETLGAQVRLGDEAATALPDGHRAGRDLARAGARTRRCSSRRPTPASRCGARSSWPGGCAPPTTRRPGWPSPAPTARPRPCGCSRRSCRPPAGARSPPATSARRWSRPCCDRAAPYDVLAVELSSFQLHWATSRRARSPRRCSTSPPTTSTGTARWRRTPRTRAASTQDAEVACVYNVADPATERLVRDADVEEGCRAVGFTLGVPAVGDARRRRRHAGRPRLRRGPAQLGGRARHGRPTCRRPPRTTSPTRSPRRRSPARTASAPARGARRAARLPARTPHRIAHVADVDGVAYVDDSKATNPHAAAASLAAYDSVVWIAGGLAKGADFDDLVAAVRAAAARRRADRRATARRSPRRSRDTRPRSPWSRSPSTDTGAMDEVVRAAARLAAPGDTVLLAPACASMDMFRDYGAARRRVRRRRAPARRGQRAGDVDGRHGRRRPQRPPRRPSRVQPRVAVGLTASLRLLDRPLTSYHLLVGCTALLLVLGLVMVLSASQRRGATAHRRLVVPIFQQAGCCGRCIGLPLPVVASRLPVRCCRRARLPAAGRRARPAVPGARARRRHRGQRQPELDRASAARSGSSRPRSPSWRWCCGAPTCWPASSGCCTQWKHLLVPLVPVAALLLGLVLLGDDLGTAIVLIAIVARPAVRRRRAGAAVRRCCGAGLVVAVALLSVTAPHRLDRFRSLAATRDSRRPRRRLAGAARQVRARQRRLVGRRPRRQPGEVGQPARGAHRLHLRHHRRGARPGRDASRCCAVRGARLRRAARRAARRRPVRPARRRRARPPGSRPGAGQHRCGARPAADRRRAAAAGLVRRLGAAADHVRPRDAAVAFARRRAGRRARRWPRAGRAGRRTRGRSGSRRRGRRRGADGHEREPSGSTASLHVVLAGGGTAGHIEPALALADALRRRDPATEVTALGTARGLETRLVPARGYELELIPPCRCRAGPTADLLPCRAGCAAATRAAEPRAATTTGADVVVGFGGYVGRCPPTSRRGAGTCRSSSTRPTPGRGWPTGSARGCTPYVAVAFPGTQLRARPLHRHAAAPRHRHPGPGRPRRAEARAAFGLDPDLPTLLVSGGSQGARRLNEAVARRRRRAARGRRPGAARGRAGQRRTDVPTASRRRGPPYVARAVRRPDGPRLRRRRPGAVPGRRDDLSPS